MRFNILKVISVVAILGLAACSPPNVHHAVKHQTTVREYHEHRKNDDGSISLIFWYILFSGPDTYYSSSSTPVTNYSSLSFSRVPGNSLPQEVEERLETAEQVGEDKQLSAQEEPATVQENEDTTQSQIEAMENEGGPSAPESSTSTESSSSSSDSGSSGGGDSGGGD